MWRILIRLSREFYNQTLTSSVPRLNPPRKNSAGPDNLIQPWRSHLELGDHRDFTEPPGGWVLCVLVSEDVVEQGVVRPLKQVDELWWHWVLKHKSHRER